MNAKWVPFALGALVGAVALLGVLQAMETRRTVVYAQDASSATSSFALGIGSTEQNRQDLVVILYKRAAEGGGGANQATERLTMAWYKPPPGNVNEPKIQLHSVREVTWDLQLMELNNSGDKTSLKDVVDTVKKQNKPKSP